MKLYRVTDHDSYWPAAYGSVVLAHDQHEARDLLDAVLVARGLKPSAALKYTLEVVEQGTPLVVLACVGDQPLPSWRAAWLASASAEGKPGVAAVRATEES